ncbi:MAG: hypothetical protein R6V19_06845 [Armatimonadota bacterium]
MAKKKLVTCEHCNGTKTCTVSGGRSCKTCLKAAGRSIHQWATVRCSYCGGIGKVWVDVEEDEETSDEASEGQAPEEQ